MKFLTGRAAWTRGSWVRTAVILGSVVLALGFGFCVLPGHHGAQGNHGPSPDLCAGLVVVLLVSIPLTKPSLSGWSLQPARRAIPPLRARSFDRPPEPAIAS